MNTFMQKLGLLATMLSAFLSASAYDFKVGDIFYNSAYDFDFKVDGIFYNAASANDYDFKVEGIYYNITDSTQTQVEVTCPSYYSSNRYTGDIVVPSSVTYNNKVYKVTAIGYATFYGCSNLTSIKIPNSVKSIGDAAFVGCSSLTSIDIDADNSNYSSIDGILYDKSQESLICCPGGKSGEVIIPNSVTAIENYAFAECSSLTSISIPNSVTTIGDAAFCYCSSLTSIAIPNSVTAIEKNAFFGCSSLTSITIPNSVTTIGDWAFSSCRSLTSITIPNSVTTIGYSAFSWCSKLTSTTIPNSVTTIGHNAFYGCSSLASIASRAVTPPECGDDAFMEIDKERCTLYVPAESVEAYKQAPEWKDFVYIKDVEAGIDSVVAGSADGATEVFNLAGAKVADTPENLPAGIYLVRQGSTVRKIVVK